ncbi:MAG TPA: AAA family ATPase, partial [Methanothrix sp.]|nr:AAA family ATPase [Methanothrix sp.]
LPGSGKGEASRIARQQGLTVLVMGDVIRQEAARQGLEATDVNLGRVGCALREAEGPEAVARRIFQEARARGEETVVVDGLRSREEADYFASQAEEFYLVEVCAPAEERLRWLRARGRPDDPGSGLCGAEEQDQDEKIISSCGEPDGQAAAALEQRECREMGWGMCQAMEAASLKLVNDGSLEEFRENARKLLDILTKD